MQKSHEENAKKVEARELFWSSCGRAGLFIILMIVVALGYHATTTAHDQRLHLNWDGNRIVAGDASSTMVRHESPDATSTPGRFFVNIAMSPKAIVNTHGGRHAERKGWDGVCVAPSLSSMHTEFHRRSCRVIDLPVGAWTGQEVAVSDCSKRSFSLQSLVDSITHAQDPTHCPQVIATTVSIAKLLDIASAPKVIDYLSLDTHGTELSILSTFPFTEHCVKAWSIMGRDEVAIDGLRQVLEVGQGCHVKPSGKGIFARCPCSKHRQADRPRSQPTISTPTHSETEVYEISSSGKPTHLEEMPINSRASGKSKKHREDVAPDQ